MTGDRIGGWEVERSSVFALRLFVIQLSLLVGGVAVIVCITVDRCCYHSFATCETVRSAILQILWSGNRGRDVCMIVVVAWRRSKA